MKKLQEFCQRLGYQFNDLTLLNRALSHRSAQLGHHNERLEFLGDALLNFIIAAELFQICSLATEGELSRLRASLVNSQTLASLARELQIGDYLRLGVGEVKSGGAQRESILADTLEAIIGAIYLDKGVDECWRCVVAWYTTRLADIAFTPAIKDAKTQLQEYLQAYKLPLPQYHVVQTSGEVHQQMFYVECCVPTLNYICQGVGSSRRKAEQIAAQQYIIWLVEHYPV